MKNVCFLLFSVQLQLELELSSFKKDTKTHRSTKSVVHNDSYAIFQVFLNRTITFFVKNWLKCKQWIIQVQNSIQSIQFSELV